MGVAEDYHGFYDEALEEAVTRTIDDMLTEAGPRRCTESEARGVEWNAKSDTLVSLLNHAWEMYRSDPGRYAEWEAEALRRHLG